MANTNVQSLLESTRQLCSLAKQYLINNDYTNFTATMTSVGTNVTSINNAVAAANPTIDVLLPI